MKKSFSIFSIPCCREEFKIVEPAETARHGEGFRCEHCFAPLRLWVYSCGHAMPVATETWAEWEAQEPRWFNPAGSKNGAGYACLDCEWGGRGCSTAPLKVACRACGKLHSLKGQQAAEARQSLARLKEWVCDTCIPTELAESLGELSKLLR